MANELKGKATAEQIAKWKKENKNVYQVEVGDSICYLKTPDRRAIGYYSTLLANNPVRANEALLENCWLGGDDAIKTEDSLFFGVSQHLAELLEVKDAELKKL